ncbi:MAG: hypothetical protein IKQ71_02520 [Lachnospiraceae bacterium]|nr:hypothetical protein [Lachnospiraceae bacterium]
MSANHVMINDIIEDQSARMSNLRKYYPFFCLMDTAFSQYKEGRYQRLDMGYLTLASLRFFINENNFNERDISFEQYEEFIIHLLRRDYDFKETSDEEHELALYIFDKLNNSGKAFEFTFYDPELKQNKTARVKYIESRISEGEVRYYITSEGIEFYLDTKEMKDESRISVQQLLLGKLIKAKNFKGGVEVVKRINSEVSKLSLKKQEVLHILSIDVFAGARALEEYMDTAAKWFKEEQKLFTKNKKLIEQAIKTAETGKGGEDSKSLMGSFDDIELLDTELKKTIKKHSDLIGETVALQGAADKIIGRAKLRRLKSVFDFRDTMLKIKGINEPDIFGHILAPYFLPKLEKSFSLKQIDNLLTYRQDLSDKAEKVIKEEADIDFKYEDELVDMRIATNFSLMFCELLKRVSKKKEISLRELNGIYEIKFGNEIFKNGDYYSFIAHLAGKEIYDMKKILEKQDTFLEGIVVEKMTDAEKREFSDICFTVNYEPDEVINPIKDKTNTEITGLTFHLA